MYHKNKKIRLEISKFPFTKLPFRLIIDLLEYYECEIDSYFLDYTFNYYILKLFGRFKLDRFRKVFLIFRSIFNWE